ncbi:relaxase/mobilization nuclease domain-containing protein [Brevundimonas sp. FT23042]|uniref:relaxase/mobilization nuclease domain-containing protein n=1 Tax=Brevundimonas sp. FT23042 TaxID=3393749 RepID=UPI003B58B012
MSDLNTVRGFEEGLRPPVDVRRARMTPAVLRTSSSSSPAAVTARVERLARGAPEVMVKVTGRTRDGAHLKAHFQYIGRNGAVALETAAGERIIDLAAVRDLATDWSEEARLAGGRRDTPLSHAVILSMPAGTDAGRLHDAARAFAGEVFSDRFAYVFALHDEGRHPHVHLTLQSLGRDGARLNPRKADLQVWRERFAHALRERGIDAEATPRRARGVTRKAERTPVRKMRERFEAGKGPVPEVLLGAAREAAAGPEAAAPWRAALKQRRERIQRAFLAEAFRLDRSGTASDQVRAAAVLSLVRRFDALATRRDRLVRQLEARKAREGDGGRDRSR